MSIKAKLRQFVDNNPRLKHYILMHYCRMAKSINESSPKKSISEAALLENVTYAPNARIYDAYVKNSIVGERSIIRDGSRIENSKFGLNVDLQRNAMIYNTEIDDYTYTGRNFVPWHSRIGKYCSISWNVSIGGANHDFHRITQHAFLYAPQFGFLGKSEDPKYNRFSDECVVGNDVWIACNAVICRGVHIGDGAVIAAGAVVTKDVEPYTIVAGVPAKVIKERCSHELSNRLINAKWWNLPPNVIKANIDLFSAEITEASVFLIEKLCMSDNSID